LLADVPVITRWITVHVRT